MTPADSEQTPPERAEPPQDSEAEAEPRSEPRSGAEAETEAGAETDDPASDGAGTQHEAPRGEDRAESDLPESGVGETAAVDDGGRGRALATATSGRRPPPRRTGVFVDADDLRSHVGELLRAILGGYEVDRFGNFSFPHDGARVFVSIGATPVGLAVNVHAVTNVDLELDEALATFIATTNHRLGFGALSWDTDNEAVWLRHTLLGTTLDAPELQAAVATIARTAAAVDDEIKQRFGGRTFHEVPADVRASAVPPSQAPSEATGTGPSGPSPGADGVASDNASGYL